MNETDTAQTYWQQKIVPVAHWFLIILTYTSPLWLSWKLFFIGLGLYYIQILIFKGCLLTYAQYKTFDKRFSTRVFTRLFQLLNINLSKQQWDSFLDIYWPLILIATCILWQIIIKGPVLISI